MAFSSESGKRWGKCTKKHAKFLKDIFKITNVAIDKEEKIVYYNK